MLTDVTSPTTVTGLTNGDAYTFSVYAITGAGIGEPGASNTVTPQPAPGAPTGVTGTPGNGQVSVSFTPPASNGGSAITGYTVPRSRGTSRCRARRSPIRSAGSRTARLHVHGHGHERGRHSAASAPSSRSRRARCPARRPASSATPGNGQATVELHRARLERRRGDHAVHGHVVARRAARSTGAASPIVVTGLTNGTSYTFTVKAHNAAGDGAGLGPLERGHAAHGARARRPVVSATPGNGQATVSFTAPASNGGAAITLYTATSSPGNLTGTSTDGSAIIVTGLTNGTSYCSPSRRTNAAGAGPASATSSPVTPRTVPGAPRVSSATAGNGAGNRQLHAARLRRRRADHRLHRDLVARRNITAHGAASPITVPGLTNGTSYTFTVIATNVAGPGAASAASNPVTPGSPPTAPGAPTGATATPATARPPSASPRPPPTAARRSPPTP